MQNLKLKFDIIFKSLTKVKEKKLKFILEELSGKPVNI